MKIRLMKDNICIGFGWSTLNNLPNINDTFSLPVEGGHWNMRVLSIDNPSDILPNTTTLHIEMINKYELDI